MPCFSSSVDEGHWKNSQGYNRTKAQQMSITVWMHYRTSGCNIKIFSTVHLHTVNKIQPLYLYMKFLPTPAGLIHACSTAHFNLWLLQHLVYIFDNKKIHHSNVLEALHEGEGQRNNSVHQVLISGFPEQGPDPAHSLFLTEKAMSICY